MKILCKKYRFNNGLVLKDVNMMSGDQNYTLIETVDLYDFLIDDSLDKIETTIDTVSDNQLSYEASDVNIKLLNVEEYRSGKILQDFFNIYNSSVYDRFEIEFTFNSGRKRTFIATNQDISIDNTESRIIKLKAIGLEKEFKEYYSNQVIPRIPSELSLPIDPLQNLYSSKLEDVFRNIFFNSTSNYFDIQFIGIDGWHILHNPYFYSPVSKCRKNLFFARTGYLNFVRQGTNLFDFFKSMCLQMGWIFYFDNKTLIIRNRYDIENYPIRTIDYSEVEYFNVSNKISDKFGTHVIIDDGEYWDDTTLFKKTYDRNYYDPGVNDLYIGDHRKIVISNTNYTNNQFYPFSSVAYVSANGTYELGYIANNLQISISRNDDDRYFKFDRESYFPNEKFGEDKFTYSKDETIEVKGAVVDRNHAAMIDLNLPRAGAGGENYGNGNFYTGGDSNKQPSGRTFAYSGNVGSCLMQYDPTTDKIMNYDDYIKTSQFQNNFKVLLKSKSQLIIELEIFDIIEMPNVRIKLSNYPYANLDDKIFCIQKIENDYYNNKTKLTIVKLFD